MISREDLDRLYAEAGRRHNVDPRLLRAIAVVESNENPQALGPSVIVDGSPTRAVGIMQIIPQTARSLRIDPRDPAQAIDGAARLISRYLTETNGDVTEALRLYYAGPSMSNRGPRTAAYPSQVAAAYARLPAYQPAPTTREPDPDADVVDALMGRSDVAGRSQVVEPSADILREMFDEDFDYDLFRELAPRVTDNNGEPIPSTPSNPQRPLGTGSRFASGVERGIRDVVDAPAEFLAGTRLGRYISDRFGAPTQAQVAEQNRRAREDFDRELGSSGFATAGRIAGNIGGVMGPLGVASGAARAGTSVIPGLVGRVAQGISGAGPRVGNLLTRTGQRAAGGAAAGALSAYMLADPDKNLDDEVGTGAAIGAGISSLVAPTVGAAYRGARNVLSGYPGPNTARLAQRAMDLGIPVYGPQISQSPPIRYLDSHLRDVMFSGHQSRTSGGREAFTQQVARLIGEPLATRLDANTRRAANQRISSIFENVARNRVLQFDPQIQARLSQIENDLLMTPMDSGVQQSLQRLIQNVRNAGASGTMSGEAYLGLTRYNTPLGRAMRGNDGNVAFYARRVRDALDEMLERSAPDAAQELRQARNQFRYMLNLVSPSTKGTREGSIEGFVDPVLFARNAYRMDPNIDSKPIGQDIVADLARIGIMFGQPPNSGSAARIAASTGGFLGLPGLGTAAAGMAFGSPAAVELGLAGALGGGAMANIISRLLASNIYRNHMIRGGMNNSPYSTNAARQGPQLTNRLGIPAGVSTENQDFSVENPLIGSAMGATPGNLDLPEPTDDAPSIIERGGNYFRRSTDESGQGFWMPIPNPFDTPPHYTAPDVVEITRPRLR